MSEFTFDRSSGDESQYPVADPIRVAISGAAGRVSYSLVYRIAAGGMFGPQQPIILRCLDVAKRQNALAALQIELREYAFPLLFDLKITTDADEAFDDADWIIMLASRTGPMSDWNHKAALEQNGPIYRDHGQAINRSAPRTRVLVAATPSHTNCLIAMTNARNLPPERWFALSQLYEIRARALIAEKLHVLIQHVNRVTVWGNPGPHLYVDFHNSFVGDSPAWRLLQDREWECQTLQEGVVSRVDEHFRLSGTSPAASAAQAILATIRSLTAPTLLMSRIGAGVVSDGSYGVPRGLIFAFPIRTEDGRKWSIAQGLYHDIFAQDRMDGSIQELQEEAVLAARFFDSGT